MVTFAYKDIAFRFRGGLVCKGTTSSTVQLILENGELGGPTFALLLFISCLGEGTRRL
jgi:hypothetical protein